jgi:hypothetical protein
LPKVNRVGANQIAISLLNEPHLFVQVIWQPKIVGIEKSNEFSACSSQTYVACGPGAAIFLFEVTDAIAEGLEGAFKVFGIGRAVIDDDDFVVGERCAKTDSSVSPM